MLFEKIAQLRQELHANAEVSNHEEKTKAILIDFLKANTALDIHPCGQGFYAAYRAAAPKKAAIALRADYDALALPDGTAAHLCGHDGHSAALCGAAILTEQAQPNRDVFFLFQPAEETGEGAEACLELFQQETVGEIYGAHNLPGLPLGCVTTRPGTFACASRGVTLRFEGKITHAAYPENGISPAEAVGKLLCSLGQLSDPRQYGGMVLCTVIGVDMGEKAFGAAAADAEVLLTLRGEHDTDLDALHEKVLSRSGELAEEYHLRFSHQVCDVFPSTENTELCAARVLTVCGGEPLPVPMRWSEDFGHYLKVCPGAFFGIGAGIDHPPLHTEHYEYPDALLRPTAETFLALILN